LDVRVIYLWLAGPCATASVVQKPAITTAATAKLAAKPFMATNTFYPSLSFVPSVVVLKFATLFAANTETNFRTITTRDHYVASVPIES